MFTATKFLRVSVETFTESSQFIVECHKDNSWYGFCEVKSSIVAQKGYTQIVFGKHLFKNLTAGSDFMCVIKKESFSE